MSLSAGRDVPKDRRTSAEISPNSAPAPGTESPPATIAPAAGRLRIDRFVLDLRRGCLLSEDREVALRPKTFEVLCHLVGNPGRLVSKDELLAAVWPDVYVTDDSLVQCIVELRRAIDDQDQRLIRTVPRRGYRFEAAPAPVPGIATGAAPTAPAQRRPAGWRRAPGLIALGVAVALLAGAGWWWLGPAERAAPPLSIVVPPFGSIGDDAGAAAFAEGIANDLTAELSRLPGLFVIAHATARTFAGKTADARAIGRALNVRYLLDGMVRPAADRVDITVQLVDTSSGASVWAERFERPRDDMPAWREDVIGRIANALNFRLTSLEGERSAREHRDNPEAHDLATRGWALVYARKAPDAYEAARTLFREAIARDPRATDAQAGLGWTSAVAVLDGWSADPDADLTAAESAVAAALAVDPNNVIAHHVRGFILRVRGSTRSANDAFRTAVALNPNFASGYAQLGATELELGRPEATVPAVEHAIRLSPRDPNLGPWLAIAGMAELRLGHYADAVTWLRRAIDTGTPVALHRAYFASALALAGRNGDARAALAKFRQQKPSATIARLRAAATSSEPAFVAQSERFYEGLRLAGLPE